jgi:hypothetical protein
VKTSLAFSIALVVVAQAPTALACVNDTDCGAACGGMVCSFAGATPTCVAASTGDPGWCTGNAGCQCAGATCNSLTHYCTYTTPPADMAAGKMDLLPADDAGPASADLATAKPDLATRAAADLAVAAPDLAAVVTPMTSSSSSSCAFGGPGLPGGVALLFASLLVGALALRRRARA